MNLKKHMILKLPAPYALNIMPRFDLAAIALIHLTLAITWLGFFIKFPTIIGIAVSFFIWIIAKLLGETITKPAKKRALNRIIISFFATIIYGVCNSYLSFHAENDFSPNQAWFLLSYVLGGLAIYDLYWLSKGFKGLEIRN